MATIKDDPKLSMVVDLPSKKVTVTVKATIFFTEPDIKVMKDLGFDYRLSCVVYGADSGLKGDDDFLFKFPSKLYGTSERTVEAVFTKVVTFSALNEDNRPNPEDEIYASLTLSHEFLPHRKAKTNTVVHEFGG